MRPERIVFQPPFFNQYLDLPQSIEDLCNNPFPKHAIQGLAKEFADLYSQYLESPWSFLAFSFLTCLGTVVANRVTLESAIEPQPRLYTILLGESADERKSECIKQTVNLFSETFNLLETFGLNFVPCFGVGSAEGLAAWLKKHSLTLL